MKAQLTTHKHTNVYVCDYLSNLTICLRLTNVNDAKCHCDFAVFFTSCMYVCMYESMHGVEVNRPLTCRYRQSSGNMVWRWVSKLCAFLIDFQFSKKKYNKTKTNKGNFFFRSIYLRLSYSWLGSLSLKTFNCICMYFISHT